MRSCRACDGKPAAFVFALARQTLMLSRIAYVRCVSLLFIYFALQKLHVFLFFFTTHLIENLKLECSNFLMGGPHSLLR